MNTQTSLHLTPFEETPAVNVYPLSRGYYIDIGGSLAIHGTQKQIDGIVFQFTSEHTKRLTNALRVLLGMHDEDDITVLLQASVRVAELEQSNRAVAGANN